MLFDILPDHFFSPLAAPGKRVYWECIHKLFSCVSKQLSFGVEREYLVEELTYYFDSRMAADLPEELEDGGETAGRSSRDKANFVLRRLESCGWIEIETDYTYVQRVNFRDYAVQIIKTLNGISEERHSEYQGYIYTIYSLLRTRSENPGVVLLQVQENTESLLTGLKSLNANIKRYIDELTRHSTVAEILDALLNDYYSNVVDKAYHRLLTSDNVSKYRPEIVEKLESYAHSPTYLKRTAAELAELRELEPEEAEEQTLELLHEIISTFKKLDEILDEINDKNTKYQRAAIGRARFLLSSSEDIRGQIKNILTYMNEHIQEKGMAYNAFYELEEMDRLIRLYSWEYLDTDSLYAPTEGRKEFHPQVMELEEPDLAVREEKRRWMEEKLTRILSVEKIGAYVEKQLAGRRQMQASELPLEEEETFIRLIYIRLYGQRKNMPYSLELGEMTEREGYRFRDFTIKRKEH